MAEKSAPLRDRRDWVRPGSVPAYKAVREALAKHQIAIPTSAINEVLTALDELMDPRCRGTLGSRPSWMSPDQYDPCRCTLQKGHEGEHACEHTGHDDV